MNPLKQKDEKEMLLIRSTMREEKMKELQEMILFYKTAPRNEILADAKRFDSQTIKQIEYSAFQKILDYNSLDDDEKTFFKGKVKKELVFNLSLMGLYKIMANPSVFFINMSIFGKTCKIFTYKKGILLWLLSPLMAQYDYQEMVMRLGTKYWLIKQNQDFLFKKQMTETP